MPDDDVQKQIEELEKKRTERRAEIKKARDEQYVKDLPHVLELEAEHGDDRVAVLRTVSFVAGLPTVVVVRTPEPDEYKRYRQKVRKAGTDMVVVGAARDELATCSVVYPDAETYKRMREAWPSLHDNVGLEAGRLGEAEGKG